jgi:hypothetical protein
MILHGLRTRIQHLEEEEILQQMLRRGSQVGLEQTPSHDNIDDLMRTMTAMSTGNGQQVSDGPWDRPKHDVSNDSFNYEDTVVRGKPKI